MSCALQQQAMIGFCEVRRQQSYRRNEPRDDRIAETVRSVGSVCVLGGYDLVGIYIADLQMARAG